MFKQTPKKRVLFVRRLTPVILGFFGVFSLVTVNLQRTPIATAAAVNSTINFEARLQTSSGAIVPDGSYNIEFKLYDAASSSGSGQGSCTGDAHCLWTETRTGGNVVDTRNGYLSVSLGSVTAFGNINWNQQLWLTMNVGGTGTPSWDGEMNPRLQLTAVPYAFQANQLAQSNSGDTLTSALNIQAPTGGNQTFQIQDQGAAGTYNVLTAPNGQDGYVKLQGSSPSQQTGYLNISGTGTFANGIQGPWLDAATYNTSLDIGSSNANTINIGRAASNTHILGTTTIDSLSTGYVDSTFNGTLELGTNEAANVYIGTSHASTVKISTSGGTTTINGVLQNDNLDTINAGDTLTIGGTNASTVNLLTNNAAHTVAIANGNAAQTVTIGSVSTTSALTLQGGSGNVNFNLDNGGGVYITSSGTQIANINSAGAWLLQPTTNTDSTFVVKNHGGTVTELQVDTQHDKLVTSQLEVQSGYNINVVSGALTLGGTATVNFHTPGSNGDGTNGSNVPTKIDIPFFNPGAYGQIIALGLPSSADTTSRAISVLDARTTAHQPSIGVFSPSENDIFGLSWDGDNSTPVVKTTTNNLALQVNGMNAVTVGKSGTDAVLNLGIVNKNDGILQFSNAGTNSIASIQATGVTSSYALNLPNSVGSANQCLGITSVSSNTASLGFSNCFIQGGNGFGATANLGTSDSYDLNLITNGATRITVAGDGSKIKVADGTVLVLGSKPTSGDPTEVDGAMYYNSNSHSFRCGIDGTWVSCVGGLLTSSTAIGASNTIANTTTDTAFTQTYDIPANYCASGRVLRITANGLYGTTGTSTQPVQMKIKFGNTTLVTSDSVDWFGGESAAGWFMTANVICPNAANSSTSVTAQGLLTMGGEANRQMPYTNTSAIDTTTTQTLKISVQWAGTADPSNTITLDSLAVEGLGP